MTLRFSLDAHVQSPTVVFDIGGTWFRSAIAEVGGEISGVRQRPAISYVSHPNASAKYLHTEFIRYLIEEVGSRMKERSDICSRVSIALGAALDQRTGIVWNAGPLWGEYSDVFDLPAVLQTTLPGVDWIIVNDVTAALLSMVLQRRSSINGTLVFVTVSTGIAARSWSSNLDGIPIDGVAGLQGEIGHLPVTCVFRGSIIRARCACGGANHLNAFSSGRGLKFLLQKLGETYEDVASMLDDGTGIDPIHSFAQALSRGYPVAEEILESAVDPVAKILLGALTMDPHISGVLFGGGVLDGIGHAQWLGALIKKLKEYGAYQITSRSPVYFESLLQSVDSHDAGLIGAAYAAWSRPHEKKNR